MFDAEHRLVLCNDRYLAMFGVSRESVVPGIGVLELFQQVECAGVFAAGPAERMHQYYRARVSAFVGFGLRDLIAKQLHQIEYVKTFLSLDVPTRFIDTYVNLSLKQGKFQVRDDDVGMLADSYRRVIVLGTAGSGKSMFMRYMVHLLTHNSNRVPILIELRNYNSFSGSDFVDFIYDLTRAEQAVSRDLLISLLKKGGFVFLLDGLDEVDFDRRPHIEKEIDSLVRRFNENSFVVTSRPADNIPNWPHFQILNIQPLSLSAAKLLVKKSFFDEEIKRAVCSANGCVGSYSSELPFESFAYYDYASVVQGRDQNSIEEECILFCRFRRIVLQT
jgi:energy-coupling factor transporter ATP-binding protein EcfA2